MSFLIDQRKLGGVTVLYLKGRVVLGEETAGLVETLKSLAVSGEKTILLNLAEVTYIDSGGLGALVRSHDAVTQQKGHLKLLRVPAKVQSLMQISKLHDLFEMFDDEASAMQSFT